VEVRGLFTGHGEGALTFTPMDGAFEDDAFRGDAFKV